MNITAFITVILLTTLSVIPSVYAVDGGAEQNKQNIQTDNTKKLESLRLAATQGDVSAQLELGHMLSNWDSGQEFSKDNIESAKWYRLAAEQGNAEAQYTYGAMNIYGLGVANNDANGLRWLTLSANQGNASAMAYIGRIKSLKHEYAEAVRWLSRGAKLGNAMAQNDLGNSYLNGEGVLEDDTLGAQWIRLAAEQGDSSAQYTLSKLYENGTGVPKDASEAAKWYRLSKEPRVEIIEVKLDDKMKSKTIKESPTYKIPKGQEQIVEDSKFITHTVTTSEEEWLKTHAKINISIFEAGIQKEVRKIIGSTDTTGSEVKRSIKIVGDDQPVSVVWNELYRTGTAKVKADGKISDIKFEYKDTFDLTLKRVN